MRIYDVSLPLSAALAGWPGDEPYRFGWSCTKGDGATVNVGKLSCSIHTGTHVDAPYHFDDSVRDGGIAAAGGESGPGPRTRRERPRSDSHRRCGACRSHRDAAPFVANERLEGSTSFLEAFPILDDDMPAWLFDRGVVLLGLDVPSVDTPDSKTLPLHHAAGRAWHRHS